MNTKIKYLSYGSISIIFMIIAFQITIGFEGMILLPLVRFVFYSLVLSFNIPVFIQALLLFGMLMLLINALNLKISNDNFGFKPLFALIQPANNIVRKHGSQNNIKTLANTGITRKQENHAEAKGQDTENGIILVSAGTVLFADKSFFKLTGLKPFEVIGKDFASIIKPQSLINFTLLHRLTATSKEFSSIIQLISRHERNIVCTPANEQKYNFEGINLFKVTQINDSIKNEQLVSSIFFNSIENQDVMNLIWDDKGVLYLNEKCRAEMPFPFGRLINNPGLLMALIHKSDRQRIKIAFENFLKSNQFQEVIRCRLFDREERFFRVSMKKVTSTNLLPESIHAIGFDITEDVLAIKKYKADVEIADAANRNKTDFLANMSHEIRSPLNGIIGFSELLADKNLSDGERERYMNIIQNNGNALVTLLSDMIDISKLESGRIALSRYRFNPGHIVEELKNQFTGGSLAIHPEVNIIFPNRISEYRCEIESDPNRLRQILINLITNAIKFTHNGFVEIGLDTIDEEMLFWVRDTGIGIPFENQKAIFERFRQVDSKIQSPILGFGLGLAISKALVELLGGNLWVESIPDKGSLFVFTIKTNIKTTIMNATQTNSNSYPVDFSNRTILIAEDIDFSFLYIEAVLRRTGAKLLWAQNGKEAVEHVKANHHIDLVLMDMHMPVMTGYDATKLITELRPGLPVIAQTAFVLPADVKKCFTSGCTGFLAKPIRKEQLLNTLSEYFDKMELAEADSHSYSANVG